MVFVVLAVLLALALVLALVLVLMSVLLLVTLLSLLAVLVIVESGAGLSLGGGKGLEDSSSSLSSSGPTFVSFRFFFSVCCVEGSSGHRAEER